MVNKYLNILISYENRINLVALTAEIHGIMHVIIRRTHSLHNWVDNVVYTQ